MYLEHTGNIMSKQIVVSDIVDDIFKTLQDRPMQGQPGLSQMLSELRKGFYAPHLAPKVQSYLENCQVCYRTQPCQNSCIRPPLQRTCDPCDGPEDIMEINRVSNLPKSNGYSYPVMACDVFSRFLFAVPLRKPDTTSVVCTLLQTFTQQPYVHKHTITDKGTAFNSQLIAGLMQASGIKIIHAILKHAQTIGMVERTHQKRKQTLMINVWADTPQWDVYFNIAVMAHNTTYQQSIERTPTEVYNGRSPHNALSLKFSIPLQTRCTKTDWPTLVDEVIKKYKENVCNIFEAFHKYKKYWKPGKLSPTSELRWLHNPTQRQVQHPIRQNPVQDFPLQRSIKRSRQYPHTQITMCAKLAPRKHNVSITCVIGNKTHKRMSRVFKWMNHNLTTIQMWWKSSNFFRLKNLK